MEQIFEFLSQKFFTALQSQKFKKKNFFWFWKTVKKFWDKNSKICFQQFVDNLVVSRMPQTACRYLENCRRRSISRKPLLFQQKLATLETGNSVDFQNILNRPSNRCLWWGYKPFCGYLIFKKYLLVGGYLTIEKKGKYSKWEDEGIFYEGGRLLMRMSS